LAQIFGYLDTTTLLNASQTSRYWEFIANSPSVLKSLRLYLATLLKATPPSPQLTLAMELLAWDPVVRKTALNLWGHPIKPVPAPLAGAIACDDSWLTSRLVALGRCDRHISGAAYFALHRGADGCTARLADALAKSSVYRVENQLNPNRWSLVADGPHLRAFLKEAQKTGKKQMILLALQGSTSAPVRALALKYQGSCVIL
jgi:hypothetical protein